MKTFGQINSLVESHKSKCGSCKAIAGANDFSKFCKCDFQPKIFVDLTLGQDKICDALSKKNVESDNFEILPKAVISRKNNQFNWNRYFFFYGTG